MMEESMVDAVTNPVLNAMEGQDDAQRYKGIKDDIFFPALEMQQFIDHPFGHGEGQQYHHQATREYFRRE
jgi:hypothetical protein